jgi:elongation factor P--(R)-beta-lysine ligase
MSSEGCSRKSVYSSAAMSTARKVEMLQDRADMMSAARDFFCGCGIMEVDTPLLCSTPPVDTHIDAIQALYHGGERRYLHTSTEYAMKRLLALGCGDIYQLSHVFRDGEYGQRHNPEFMMAEWYRKGFSFEAMMQETVRFIELFLGTKKVKRISYREAFEKHIGIDYSAASEDEIRSVLEGRGIILPSGGMDKEGLLNIALGAVIEPQFSGEALYIFQYYPSSQAALAKTRVVDGEEVAERFEIYYEGVELANGYHELVDAKEQRHRFEECNEKRASLGKEQYPLDERFLGALEDGMPGCCGVAVGFDRLMMLRHEASSLCDILPFSWEEC